MHQLKGNSKNVNLEAQSSHTNLEILLKQKVASRVTSKLHPGHSKINITRIKTHHILLALKNNTNVTSDI